MRLAISNLAWNPQEDSDVATILRDSSIDAIDVAPGKYFPDIINTQPDDITYIKNWWLDRGIEIVGMQSLLFGTQGLNLFGDQASQKTMLHHLEAVCRIGAGLGAKRLVFGSPRNRDRSGLTNSQSLEKSVSFFRRLGDIAAEYDVIICLEPNPAAYQANFMTNSKETADIVRYIDHPSIFMQFDTGALIMNYESAEEVLQYSSSIVGHIHLSEPYLKPFGGQKTNYSEIKKSLLKHLPDHIATIEMLLSNDGKHISNIRESIKKTINLMQ